MRGKDVGRRGGCRARDGVDDGVGCGGVAWAARSAGVCVVSERVCPSRRGRASVTEPSLGRGDQPSRFARLRSSRCRRLWSARFWCGDVMRTMARSALCCTGVHGPPGACTRAHSAAAAAISRHAATAVGVGPGAPRSTWSLSAVAKALSQWRRARRTAAWRARSSRAVARTPSGASRRVSQKSAPERRS